MATKTFKIGLSNTDKQNMAQDVYERVLALTFAEYNSSSTYDEGDFVVYEDTLYKCLEDDVTGTWDSSKWQQATLQDLLDDIEDAVAFVNDKANVDGNYPTMTVGAADNLTPYDEDSGIEQEQPFLLQGTGCGNGEQQVDTGALGLLKEKQGNTVVVNQLARPLSATYWNAYQGSLTFTDGVCELTPIADAQYPGIIQTTLLPKSGHYYLVNFDFKGEATLNINFGGVDTQIASGLNTSVFTNITKLVLCSNESAYLQLFVVNGTNVQNYKNIICIDLTQWFGSNDNIPAHLLAHPENFFRYYQGSLAYNTGTPVSSNATKLKTIGRNVCDGEYEGGYINDSGEPYALNNTFRTKNFIKVVPNAQYHMHTAYSFIVNCAFLIVEYDKDQKFIKVSVKYSDNFTYTVSPNCCYLKLAFYKAGSSWHTNIPTPEESEITVSIYYDGESGYDQYYPYEELANIDTGTEALRSAGSVKDSKAPDGTITRRVGYVDLGTLDWGNATSGGWVNTSSLQTGTNAIKPPANNQTKANIISTIALTASADYVWSNYGVIGVDNGGGLVLHLESFANKTGEEIATALSGVYLFYELAEPTTEQGTPFSENVAINDFGSMDFGGANGVPQGASIFYAVDYKAFVDSLYNTLDGDATDIVKESELDSKLATLGYVKLTSISGYDAAKTQTLKNVEGTLTWVDDE